MTRPTSTRSQWIHLVLAFILLYLIPPSHALYRPYGLPLFVKLIFVFIGVLFLIILIYAIRRYMLMRQVYTRPVVISTHPNPHVTTISTGVGHPGQHVQSTTISTGMAGHPGQTIQLQPITGVYYPAQSGEVYFPAPHQPPAAGFNLPGAPPPYHPVAPPNHQSYPQKM